MIASSHQCTISRTGSFFDLFGGLRKTEVWSLVIILVLSMTSLALGSPIAGTIDDVGPKIVKLYGAGGFRGLEAYQSGFLISAEGHILTAWSYVLDTDYITATLADGRRFQATLVGADPRLEVAVLKIEATALPHFDLGQAAEAEVGTRILAFSNLFGVAMGDEPASIQHGLIAARTQLEARKGVFETAYRGPVYVLDVVTNNPGAAGGALVTRRGRLLGILGKELRNARTNTWLNYAIPIGVARDSVEQILAGKAIARENPASEVLPERPLTLSQLGMVMIPDVLERTPPYIDHVRSGSVAAAEGLRPDDLVLLVEDRLVPSCKALVTELSHRDYRDPLRLTIERDGRLVEVVLQLRDEGDNTIP